MFSNITHSLLCLLYAKREATKLHLIASRPQFTNPISIRTCRSILSETGVGIVTGSFPRTPQGLEHRETKRSLLCGLLFMLLDLSSNETDGNPGKQYGCCIAPTIRLQTVSIPYYLLPKGSLGNLPFAVQEPKFGSSSNKYWR